MALGALAACVLLGGCEKLSGGPRKKTSFDGDSAIGYVRTQLAFGPRIPGTLGHRRTGDWIVAQMRERADTVVVQQWTHVTVTGDTLPLRNVLARWRPELTDRVLYVTHWDTRPISDEAVVPAQRLQPVPGANDGASGVALFVALGDVLRHAPPTVGVDLLFVDGEDYGDFNDGRDVLLGSKHFAANLPAPSYRPLFGVLWDMIGDADLSIPQERNSMQRAPEVVARVWAQAEDLGYGGVFVGRDGGYITDDHIPLLDAGLRVIDVIDLQYVSPQKNYHHTPFDTIDKISARSLQVVGDVATALVGGK